MSRRLYKYDNLKAVLIYLVILGHMVRPFGGAGAVGVFLYMFIYLFHMPAFIYVLGKFMKPSPKKIGKFILLYVVFQLAYIAFYSFVLCDEMAWDIFTPVYSMWYLFAVIVYTALAFVFPKDISLKKKLVILGISILVSLGVGFCSFVGPFLSLSRIIVFFPFFLAGRYGIFKDVCERFPVGRAIVFGLMSVVGSLVYIVVSSCNDLALHNKLCYAEVDSSWVDRFIALIVGFCFIRFLLYVMPNRRIPVLTSIGQHTLFIFLWHGFVVLLMTPLMTSEYATLFFFGGSVVILLVLWGSAQAWAALKRCLGLQWKMDNGEACR